MKKLFVFVICFLIFPGVYNAAWSSSGGGGGGSGAGGCYIAPDGVESCSGWVRFLRFGGLRITFVDKDGNAIEESGGKSYDFLTNVTYADGGQHLMPPTAIINYNAYPKNKNKIAMNTFGASYQAGTQPISSYFRFGDVITSYYSKVNETRLISSDAFGNTGGNQNDGYTREKAFMKNLTNSSNPNAANDINAFIEAIGEVTKGFDIEKLKFRYATGCKGGDQMFIMWEPLVGLLGKPGVQHIYVDNTQPMQYFLGTLPDMVNFNPDAGHWSLTGINTSMGKLNEISRLMFYGDVNIEAFEGADFIDAVMAHMNLITSAESVFNRTGLGMWLNWITDSTLGCQTCSFVNGVFTDGNELYDSPSKLPQPFKSVPQYAFTEKKNGGAECCESLKNQIADKGPEWQQKFKELCSNPDDKNTCPCEDAPKEPKIAEVSNCCEESTNSFVSEYSMDEILCDDPNLNVEKYGYKCNLNVDKYKDTTTGLNPKYCEMLCSERLTVEQPGPISVDTGRNFKIGVNPTKGTTGLYMDAYRRCRIRIDYNEWREDYKNAVNEQINAYNAFMEASARLDVLKAANSNKRTESKSIDATCEDNITHNKTTRSGNSESFTVYSVNNISYEVIPNITNAGEIVIKNGTRKNTNVSEIVEGANAAHGRLSASCQSGIETKLGDTYHNDKSDTASIQSQITAAENDIKSAQQRYTTAYNTLVQLEKDLSKCDNYFTEDATGSNAEASFQFKPTVSFEYRQVYVKNGKEEVTDEVYAETVPMQTNCEYTTILNAADPDGETAPDRYSSTIGSGMQVMGRLNNQPLNKDNNINNYRVNNAYTANKKFTTDAKYRAECTLDVDEGERFNLYPTGEVYDVIQPPEFNFDYWDNNIRYVGWLQIFLSTFKTKYQTFWHIENLGHASDKFNQYIKNYSTTCAKTDEGSDGLTCTLAVSSKDVRFGECTDDITNPSTRVPEECHRYPNPDISNTGFLFKVIEPANPFPELSDSSDGKQATNWTKTEYGQKVLQEVIETGKKSNTYNPDRISYAFTLSPSDMKKIKKYNASREANGKAGFGDFKLKCECPTEPVDSVESMKACSMCKSDFIYNSTQDKLVLDSNELSVNIWDKSIDLAKTRDKIFNR